MKFLRFIRTVVLNDKREICDRGLVITGFVLQRSQREMYQRWSAAVHASEDLFAATDRFVYLKPVPTTVVIAEDLIRR